MKKEIEKKKNHLLNEKNKAIADIQDHYNKCVAAVKDNPYLSRSWNFIDKFFFNLQNKPLPPTQEAMHLQRLAILRDSQLEEIELYYKTCLEELNKFQEKK